jgi:septum site-determining protein MinC
MCRNVYSVKVQGVLALCEDNNELSELGVFYDENTILVQRTLRSGQSISYDGNVVILGDVNPGAEVVATGDVIVMGSLRGVVHAGAKGDVRSMVVAFKLLPTQLRIANHITRAPDDEVTTVMSPEIASLKDGVVTIEAFSALKAD